MFRVVLKLESWPCHFGNVLQLFLVFRNFSSFFVLKEEEEGEKSIFADTERKEDEEKKKEKKGRVLYDFLPFYALSLGAGFGLSKQNSPSPSPLFQP